jgi:hypothetical protein
MSYSEKLRNPKWQKKRLKILERDDFTCQLCGDKETELHIHHTEYKGDPWEVSDEFLKTICKDCHGAIHYSGINKNIKIIKSYNELSETSDVTIITKNGLTNYMIVDNQYFINHSLSIEQIKKIYELYKKNNILK